MRGRTGSGSNSDGMVTPQHKRHKVFVERLLDDVRQSLARFRDFIEIPGFFLAVRLFFGLAHLKIAYIFHLTAKLLESRLKTGHSQSRRTHVNAAAAGAQVHRHTDDSDFFGHWLFFRESMDSRTADSEPVKDKRDRASVGRG